MRNSDALIKLVVFRKQTLHISDNLRVALDRLRARPEDIARLGGRYEPARLSGDPSRTPC
jgi:hypothetical protein